MEKKKGTLVAPVVFFVARKMPDDPKKLGRKKHKP